MRSEYLKLRKQIKNIDSRRGKPRRQATAAREVAVHALLRLARKPHEDLEAKDTSENIKKLTAER